MVQVLIFGAVLTFGGYDKAEGKILQGRSLLNLVLSVDNALLCMFQRVWTEFQDIGVLIFGGYVLSGHCSGQQISVKNEGYLFSEGYLFTGFYGIGISVAARETSLLEGRSTNSTTQKCQFAMEIRPVAGVDALKRRAQYSVLCEYHMNKSAAAQ